MEFKGKVDGRSAVEVLAPGGTVTFDPPSLTDEVGAKIDGESRVAITARDVRFRSILNGTEPGPRHARPQMAGRSSPVRAARAPLGTYSLGGV